MIIDFHTHTFPDAISEKVLAKLSRLSHTKYFTDGSVRGLTASMKKASVDYSVNLPVMTSAEQVEKVNSALIAQKETLMEQGILTFGGMHPEYENFKNELIRLRQHHVPGIKIHPAYQNTDIDDSKMMRIIDEIRPEKFVLAHMGNWGLWEDVERDLAGAPVWFDTAFAIGDITPDDAGSGTPYLSSNLKDEDFIRIVRKHGADKILFATDSPWEDQTDYVKRIESLPLSYKERQMIFGENAEKLLFP